MLSKWTNEQLIKEIDRLYKLIDILRRELLKRIQT